MHTGAVALALLVLLAVAGIAPTARAQQSHPPPPERGIAPVDAVRPVTEYARAGSLELGGSFGLSHADESTHLSVAATAGFFVMDRVEASALLGLHYATTRGEERTFLTLLAEPSYHVPLGARIFAFGGLGLGVAYANGPGVGLAVGPRLGLKLLIGRGGVFAPALQLLYATGNTLQVQGANVTRESFTYGATGGFTVLW